MLLLLLEVGLALVLLVGRGRGRSAEVRVLSVLGGRRGEGRLLLLLRDEGGRLVSARCERLGVARKLRGVVKRRADSSGDGRGRGLRRSRRGVKRRDGSALGGQRRGGGRGRGGAGEEGVEVERCLGGGRSVRGGGSGRDSAKILRVALESGRCGGGGREDGVLVVDVSERNVVR